MSDSVLTMLVGTLAARFGRLPTEDEVVEFINGDQETRDRIWNTEIKENPNG